MSVHACFFSFVKIDFEPARTDNCSNSIDGQRKQVRRQLTGDLREKPEQIMHESRLLQSMPTHSNLFNTKAQKAKGKSGKAVSTNKSSKAEKVSKAGKMMKGKVHKPSNPLSSLLPLSEMPSSEPSALVIMTSKPTTMVPTTSPTEMIPCNCAPISYTFNISLSQTCEENHNIGDNNGNSLGYNNEGVHFSHCVIDDATRDFFPNTSRRNRLFPVKRDARNLESAPVKITSVVFVELDRAGGVDVVSKDNTYAVTDLADGDVIQFTSVSVFLNPELPLSQQQDMLPGGVAIVLYGVDAQGNPITNRVVWWYNVDQCDGSTPPLKIGDEIGWINVVSA